MTVTIHFFFNRISIATQELIIYLHSYTLMLGIVYAFSCDSHVRIDIFFQKFKKTKQAKINFFGALLLLLPFFIFILYASLPYVISSWSRLEGSSEPGGLPFVYILKSLLIIMPFMMIMYSLYKIFRNN
jgi:TRAP-type mannitol/chloroaromatic compound transport system permease small subunit